jgi:predicted metal-dependent hydrolase
MLKRIRLGDVAIHVIRKDIKNVHLSVYPPMGRVRISAPTGLSMDTIRLFAISKLGWIKRQQKKFREQERETRRELLDRESHFVWGRRYLLKVVEADAAPRIELSHNRMILYVRPGSGSNKKGEIVERWYREQVRLAVPALLAKWEPVIGIRVERFFVQRMKTKWGSCNNRARRIRLNTDLAKKPIECLEYVVVHELVHILEPTHSERFHGILERALPNWRIYKDELNRLPIRHEEWDL